MFEIGAKTKVKVRIYGAEYDLSKPTVKDIETFQDSMEVANSESAKFKLTKTFVVGLGLPLAIADSMEMEHFTQLLSHLSGSKKN